MEILRVSGLTFYYNEAIRPALDEVNVSIEQGDFVTLCGPSGCGKSTLLRHLKTNLSPCGQRRGEILYRQTPIDELSHRITSEKIGFVMQSPENQIVTDKVWHELAFGLESLGKPTEEIRGRVSEIASFFGIQQWFHQEVEQLSGGQKQLLNLASIMVMNPDVLILDEPTSQLDPIAAEEFIRTLYKINREIGTTIILTEHRLEEVLPLSNRVLFMSQGRILYEGSAREVGESLRSESNAMFLAMPTPMRIHASVPNQLNCPLTVREGKKWLDEHLEHTSYPQISQQRVFKKYGRTLVSGKGIWFKYEKTLPDVVKNLSLSVREGEFFALLGGNGTGKTTTLGLLAEINKPYRGELRVEGKVSLLPQNPKTLFVKKTVLEELEDVFRGNALKDEASDNQIATIIALCELNGFENRHPYDLSGGEQQRLALAKILLVEPAVLLLDEPTKGMDAEFKVTFASILETLLNAGVAVIMVSHDIEFCASYADTCALFFDGNIVTAADPKTFFSNHTFYTTSAHRMARHVASDAITQEDVVRLCGGVPVKPVQHKSRQLELGITGKTVMGIVERKESSQLKKLILALTLLVCSALMFMTLRGNVEGKMVLIYSGIVIALIVAAVCVYKPSPPPIYSIQPPKSQRQLTKKAKIAMWISVVLMILTLYVGVFYLRDKKYYFIGLMILLESCVPLVILLESKNSSSRELVLVASLCGLGIVGRSVFFMLPQFKPVMALVILSGVGFGAEIGVLVGALTMLSSNVIFGQGPWTPWQMFAMGVVGLTSGILFQKGIVLRTRASLTVYGILVAFFIYGAIMNPASALMWQSKITKEVLCVYYIKGFPMDLIHGIATGFFLWFLSEPMLEKFERLKIKYNL